MVESYAVKLENLGPCPICGRDMLQDGVSVNKHHFIPKSRGGKEAHYCHTLCHNKIHSLWSVKELESTYADPQAIREDARMQDFIKWVAKKEPTFYISTASAKSKKGR